MSHVSVGHMTVLKKSGAGGCAFSWSLVCRRGLGQISGLPFVFVCFLVLAVANVFEYFAAALPSFFMQRGVPFRGQHFVANRGPRSVQNRGLRFGQICGPFSGPRRGRPFVLFITVFQNPLTFFCTFFYNFF